MRVINVRNVHEALPEALYTITREGVQQDSRNGPVLRHLMPVTTCYSHPRERVLFWPERDANPFFHFMEGLWMLNGQNDVATLTQYVGRMKDFSDDGKVFHGAYGHRWRKHFGHNQLGTIALALRADEVDRRQVLQMYDTRTDVFPYAGKDVPCNLMACFQVNGGVLDMIVYNRSNDIIWGCYGANAVHFSMLQEVMAAMVGVPVGRYWQVSFNWHAYLATLEPLLGLQDRAAQPPSYGNRTPYEAGECEHYRMVNVEPAVWFQDLAMFMAEGDRALGYRDSFFRRVAIPMLRTHRAFKTGGHDRFALAYAEAGGIAATDWRKAATEWLARREDRKHG